MPKILLNDLYKGRFMLAFLLIASLSILTPNLSQAVTQVKDYQSGKAQFDLSVNSKSIPYDVFFHTVMPEQSLQLKSSRQQLSSRIQVNQQWQKLSWKNGDLLWKAPKAPGLYKLETTDAETGHQITVSVFVLRPASEMKNGVLNGYKIGEYPSPLKGLPNYAAPKGFIEVTKEKHAYQNYPAFHAGTVSVQTTQWFPKVHGVKTEPAGKFGEPTHRCEQQRNSH